MALAIIIATEQSDYAAARDAAKDFLSALPNVHVAGEVRSAEQVKATLTTSDEPQREVRQIATSGRELPPVTTSGKRGGIDSHKLATCRCPGCKGRRKAQGMAEPDAQPTPTGSVLTSLPGTPLNTAPPQVEMTPAERALAQELAQLKAQLGVSSATPASATPSQVASNVRTIRTAEDLTPDERDEVITWARGTLAAQSKKDAIAAFIDGDTGMDALTSIITKQGKSTLGADMLKRIKVKANA